jgi:hypothetical protein
MALMKWMFGFLFDHFVGDGQQPRWKGETEGFCGFEVDEER